MNNSILKKDRSIFLSHLSVNNAVASKSRDLRRLSSYSLLTRHHGDSDVEESVSAESSASADRDRDRTHHDRNEWNLISAQQRQEHYRGLLRNREEGSNKEKENKEEKENIARAVERIGNSVESIGGSE
jgi:predicted Fe-S protein YdhL (DUF1289 family)